jgi:hypothetical protein
LDCAAPAPALRTQWLTRTKQACSTCTAFAYNDHWDSLTASMDKGNALDRCVLWCSKALLGQQRPGVFDVQGWNPTQRKDRSRSNSRQQEEDESLDCLAFRGCLRHFAFWHSNLGFTNRMLFTILLPAPESSSLLEIWTLDVHHNNEWTYQEFHTTIQHTHEWYRRYYIRADLSIYAITTTCFFLFSYLDAVSIEMEEVGYLSFSGGIVLEYYIAHSFRSVSWSSMSFIMANGMEWNDIARTILVANRSSETWIRSSSLLLSKSQGT